jgi:serine O-acetyltransferase
MTGLTQIDHSETGGETTPNTLFPRELTDIVDQLVLTCERKDCFDHVSLDRVPSRESIIDVIDRARRMIYPGYFTHSRVDRINLETYFNEELKAFFEILSEQLTLSIRHHCLRRNQSCNHSEDMGQKAAMRFVRQMPRLREVLSMDVCAAYEGDPAAKSYDEIIFSYPGLFAITVYRIAHILYEENIPLMPRIMTEYAHSVTGIDIHPGAKIGESFFIDHGTGVVVGETTKIGNRVRIYQGVTLGALSVPKESVEKLRDERRHPTIEDDVIIYAGATILGGETIIGARSVIGGNVWITDSVPPDTKVFLKRPELGFEGQGSSGTTRESEMV